MSSSNEYSIASKKSIHFAVVVSYLALHRTAPMGTILKVRNEMNNREVFVRVQGKLPDTALTDKVIIRISRSAYDRLGAIDPRFRVEVTYYK